MSRSGSPAESGLVARHLAGNAKFPTIDLYAYQAAYGACVRDRYAVVRRRTDPADTRECNSGTVFAVDCNDPRILYWGAAAPLSSKGISGAE